MNWQKTVTARGEGPDGDGSNDYVWSVAASRLRELAEERRRWGCPLLYMMLRREGWQANHKRVERLYREEGLSLRRRRRRIKPGPSISFTTA